ncbi:hypothetical protein CSKR_200751 [Clonorchis sinensis]|uniref:Uncharacterized protein n=1 Tax=Clonorchis sinensis TaxID=79923 RepID=A0A8T1MHX8_CLOSI|nr:hypothetical protein CSKR_200751 [Clonorchis sinensis]
MDRPKLMRLQPKSTSDMCIRVHLSTPIVMLDRYCAGYEQDKNGEGEGEANDFPGLGVTPSYIYLGSCGISEFIVIAVAQAESRVVTELLRRAVIRCECIQQ